MDKVFFERQLYSFISLYYLYRFRRILIKTKKDPEVWIKEQNRNIRKFINYIYKFPFYRSRFDSCGLKPNDIRTADDFLKLPFLSKTEYRDWINSELSKTPEKFKNYRSRTTSGTSGVPLKLYMLPRDTASDVANLFRAVYLNDSSYKTFTNKIFSMMIPDATKQSFFQKLGILSVKSVSAASQTEDIIEEFNSFKPHFFYGNKSAMQLMAQFIVDNNIQIHHPQIIGSISEKLESQSRNLITKAFGTYKLFDIYGTAEVGNFAVEKAGAPYEHIIWNDTHVVNVVDDDGNPVKNGVGKILVTPLFHKGFPLLNYELNDYVEIETIDGIMYIKQIWGRANDVIKNSDGTTYGWMQITRMVSGLVNLMQYRVVQNSYEQLDFYMVASSEDKEIRAEIEKHIREIGKKVFEKHPKKIIFSWMKTIEPDPNGKVRMLISNVK